MTRRIGAQHDPGHAGANSFLACTFFILCHTHHAQSVMSYIQE